MYLHKEDRELLKDIIITVSEKSGLDENIVEKDYYVTLILKELVKGNPSIVFKGGTSLSKAYHVIERFSEDIDITFTEHIGEARRKKLKYNLLKPISETLGLPIDNWDTIESDKDLNQYDFRYDAVMSSENDVLIPYVKVETSLMSYSYPTEQKEISSIIYEYLKEDNMDIIEEFDLMPFIMSVQSLDRTFIDKLFAVCDYYMNGKATRNSRHLYDIYKLYPYIKFENDFKFLLDEVRALRAKMDIRITPSARFDVDIMEIAQKLVDEDFYAKDYEDSTIKLTNDYVEYQKAKEQYLKVIMELFGNYNG